MNTHPIYTRRLDVFMQAINGWKEELAEAYLLNSLPLTTRRLDIFSKYRKLVEKQSIQIGQKQISPKTDWNQVSKRVMTLAERKQWINRIWSAFYEEPLPMVEHFTPGSKRLITHLPNGTEITYQAFNGGAELSESLDTSQRNTDIPDAIHGWEQGWLEERKNPDLDYRGIDDRDFRQRCVVYNGRLHVLYQKQKVDMKLPQHLDPAWISGKLNCTEDVATHISQGFIALGFNRNDCIKLLFKDAIYFELIRIPQVTDGVELANHLSKLADSLDEVTVQWQNCFNSDDVERDLLQQKIKRRPDSPFIYENEENPEDLDRGHWLWSDEEFESVYPNDDLDNRFGNPFGAHPLFHGNEAVSHEFINMLRFASTKTLQDVIDKLPKWSNGQRQNGRYLINSWGVQYFKRYDLYYLTNSQISQIWVYIKARREQLKTLAKRKLSPDARSVIQYMNEQDANKKLAAAMIYSWRDNRPFNLYGITLNWNSPADSTELSVVWDRWHKMK